MKTSFLRRAAIGLIVAGMLPTAALAQAGWTPASEVVGQPIMVTTNGVTNTVYLDPGGQVRIITSGGNTVSGTWTAGNGQLCLGAAGARECVPYAGPFQAGLPATLTSSCGTAETWLAQATNQPPPTQVERGERGH